MELREIFRPGWRMIAAIIAVLSGPVSAVQNVWIAGLALRGKPVPTALVGLPIYIAPIIAVVAIAALYIGELSRSRELEIELGRLPSHRVYVRESPEDLLKAVRSSDWRDKSSRFRKLYKGRWIRGEAVIVSISDHGYNILVQLGSAGPPGSDWGWVDVAPWQRRTIDHIRAGDRVEYEGKISGISVGNLRLARARLRLLSEPADAGPTTTGVAEGD